VSVFQPYRTVLVRPDGIIAAMGDAGAATWLHDLISDGPAAVAAAVVGLGPFTSS
jgi:hypothetical protein